MLPMTVIFRAIIFLMVIAPSGEEVGFDLIEDGRHVGSLIAYAQDDAVRVDSIDIATGDEQWFVTLALVEGTETEFAWEDPWEEGVISLAEEMEAISGQYFVDEGEIEIETGDGDLWTLTRGMAGTYLYSDMLQSTFVIVLPNW